MNSVCSSAPACTRSWGVLLVLAGGIVAALQAGKAAIAAPMLQSDLRIDFAAVGWLTGVFALLGLIGGIPAGALVASFGDRRVLTAGLLTTAGGAALGASAASFSLILIARCIEGAGFLFISVSAPSVLERVTKRSRRDRVLALWSCFMPTGIALAMFAGPLFDDWRSMWWASCALALAIGIAIPFVISRDECLEPWSWRGFAAGTAAVVRFGRPLLLAAVFALYSVMFFALFSFLPVLLMERMHVTHGTAGLLSAFATAANILGNLTAGFLLSHGSSRACLLASASLAMGCTSLGIFMPVLPDTPTFVLCVIFSTVGGLIPAALMSSVPLAAPIGLSPVAFGLMVQGSNLGQIIGPVAVGGIVQAHGWGSAALVVIIAALLAIAFSRRLQN